MQLGLSRRNKHIKLRSEKSQLQLSKVHPNKNLAHSLTNTASDQKMLAKLRIDTEAAEILALSTVQGHCLASFGSSSSLLVGMVAAKPSPMAKPQLRKPSELVEKLRRQSSKELPELDLDQLELTNR